MCTQHGITTLNGQRPELKSKTVEIQGAQSQSLHIRLPALACPDDSSLIEFEQKKRSIDAEHGKHHLDTDDFWKETVAEQTQNAFIYKCPQSRNRSPRQAQQSSW